jgi:hypothetical protein
MPTKKRSFSEISDYRNTVVSEDVDEDSGIRRTNVRSVTLYNTEIFRVDYTKGRLVLNTGGHFTATTKRRMNEALMAADLTYRVSQTDYEWHVWDYNTHEQVAEFNGDRAVVIDL